MPTYEVSPDDEVRLGALIEKYEGDSVGYKRLARNLHGLMSEVPLVHSLRARPKESKSLYDKLVRKLEKAEAGGPAFDITPDNLFEKINDLAGVRLIHLHTSQFPKINESILTLLSDQSYLVLEGPKARVWDHEYKEIFEAMGIETEINPRMYMSVHYIVKESVKSKRTAEIQVRTLAEELWGEVDHSFNYPVKSTVTSCREQLKVLARAASTCTRLVDSIYHTKNEAEKADAKP